MIIVAHGARSKSASANTVAALDTLLELGIRAVEVDVQFGERGPVLAHDAPPPLDAAPIDAVLTRATGFDYVMLDIKDPRAVEPTAGAVNATGLGNVVFAGTDPSSLMRARAATRAKVSLSFPEDRPRVTEDPRLQWLVDSYLAAARLLLPLALGYWWLRYRPDQFTIYRRAVSPSVFLAARLLRTPVFVWTVDDIDEALRLVDQGAAGIITNDPEKIAHALRANDLSGAARAADSRRTDP